MSFIQSHTYNPAVEKVVPKDAIVLDLDTDYLGNGQLVAKLRRDGYLDLARQIEAQTKLPRIPEPGWGEKVIASVKRTDGPRREFVHAFANTEVGTVWTDANGFHASWSDLIAPILVRDGIEGAS